MRHPNPKRSDHTQRPFVEHRNKDIVRECVECSTEITNGERTCPKCRSNRIYIYERPRVKLLD